MFRDTFEAPKFAAAKMAKIKARQQAVNTQKKKTNLQVKLKNFATQVDGFFSP